MEVLQMLGVALGLAGLAGINLYLTVFVTGLAVRMEWIVLSPQYHDLAALGDPLIIGVAGCLYFIEFFADKIPWIDSAWDAVHTFIRPVGSAALAVATIGTAHPTFAIVAALVAGGVGLSTHVAKAATRLVANGSPEPISNIGLSLLEDGIVLGGLTLIAWHPVLALALTVVATVCIVCMFPSLWRGILARLWLAWRKLNAPMEDAMPSQPGQDLPGACETILRRSDSSKAAIEWAVPCLSGGGPRLPANLHGWLLALHKNPGQVFFVARRWAGGTLLEMDASSAVIELRPGFLCDKLLIVHRDGSPKHAFLFEWGQTKLARRISVMLREQTAGAAAPLVAG